MKHTVAITVLCLGLTSLSARALEPSNAAKPATATGPASSATPTRAALADLIVHPDLKAIWVQRMAEGIISGLKQSKRFKEIVSGASLKAILPATLPTRLASEATLEQLRLASGSSVAMLVRLTPIRTRVQVELWCASAQGIRRIARFTDTSSPPQPAWLHDLVRAGLDPRGGSAQTPATAPSSAGRTDQARADGIGSGLMLAAMGFVSLGFAQSLSDDADHLRRVATEPGSIHQRSQADSWKVSDRMAYGGLAMVVTGVTLASWSALSP